MAARLIHTGCSVTNSDPQNDCAFDIEKIAQTFLCVSTFPFFAVGHLKLDIGGNCDVLSIIVKWILGKAWGVLLAIVNEALLT